MKLLKRTLALLLLLATLLSSVSCLDGTALGGDEGGSGDGAGKPSAAQPNTRVFYDYFDTWGTLYDYSGASYESFSRVADEVEALIKEYHELYDIYGFYSGKNNLATINANAGGDPVPVDGKIIELLKFSKEVYEITNGETNVAFGAVLSIWHDYREAGVAIPDIADLREAAKHCDINCVIIDEARGTVQLTDPEMSLDVGAVAKGFAVEKVAEYIKSRGLDSYFFDMGGNLRAIGAKPDGSAWRAASKNNTDGSYAAIFELRDSALVTSGSSERAYFVDGVRYHHIIDRVTLFPENRYLSVSVHAPSSALADALSTAVFNMEIEEAEALVSQMPEISLVFVLADGSVLKMGKDFS